MTQISRPQQGRQITYPDAGGYTANQWARLLNLQVRNEADHGVFYAIHDALEVTNPSGVTIRVAAGGALVRGHGFLNEDTTTPSGTSNVDFTPSTPAASRTDTVVLVQNNTDNAYDGTPDYGAAVLEFPTALTDYGGLSSVPAHSCRLAILTGVDGGAARALTQDIAVAGDIWMLELATYDISSVPVVSNLSDHYDREFVDAEWVELFVPAAAVEEYTSTTTQYIGEDSAGDPVGVCPDSVRNFVEGVCHVPQNYIDDTDPLAWSCGYLGALVATGDLYGFTGVVRWKEATASAQAGGGSLGTEAWGGAADFGKYQRFFPITLDTSTPELGDILTFQFARYADLGSDTLTGSAVYIWGWVFKYWGWKR